MSASYNRHRQISGQGYIGIAGSPNTKAGSPPYLNFLRLWVFKSLVNPDPGRHKQTHSTLKRNQQESCQNDIFGLPSSSGCPAHGLGPRLPSSALHIRYANGRTLQKLQRDVDMLTGQPAQRLNPQLTSKTQLPKNSTRPPQFFGPRDTVPQATRSSPTSQALFPIQQAIQSIIPYVLPLRLPAVLN